MIEIKPPEEEPELLKDDIIPIVKAEDLGTLNVGLGLLNIRNELHELNKTLKEILREMRKRKV